MKLAGVVSIGSYTAEDLARKQQSLKAVLHPDTQLDMFAADSGVPYIISNRVLNSTCRKQQWRARSWKSRAWVMMP